MLSSVFYSNDTPAGPKKQAPAAGPKGGFGMIFHIAVCSPDSVLRSRVERQCLDYYARRDDACIIEQLDSPEARDDAGERYELYLIELPSTAAAASLRAAAALRSRGRRSPLAFLAHTPAHAYSAYRVDAMQYLLLPVPPEQLDALLARAAEPEYGPAIPVATAPGLRVLPFADIEYLECTHHVVHFHLASGEDVPSLSVRVPFAQVAQPLLADERFVQLHRSYVVNLAAVSQLAADAERRTGPCPPRAGACSPHGAERLSGKAVPIKQWGGPEGPPHCFIILSSPAASNPLCTGRQGAAIRADRRRWSHPRCR